MTISALHDLLEVVTDGNFSTTEDEKGFLTVETPFGTHCSPVHREALRDAINQVLDRRSTASTPTE